MIAMSTSKTTEMQRFNSALSSILRVSKNDLKEMLAEEKVANAGKLKPGPKPKTSASGHGVSGKG
jgi:hypothetical protein